MDLEAELQKLRDQIQRLEKELEKVQAENLTLQNSEAKAKDALSQQINRNHVLQKDLEEAQTRIKELQGVSFNKSSSKVSVQHC